VLNGAFTDEYASALREEAHRNHAAQMEGRDDSGSFRATMLVERGVLWEEAAIHPWLLTLAEHLLGRGCLMFQSDTIVKKAGQDTHPGLHSDYGASRVAEPFPDYCVLAVGVWAIDDFLEGHGPTVLKPYSHLERRMVPPGTTQDEAVTLHIPKGSIAFWHGALWHGSTPRTAPGYRTSLHNAYARNFVRVLERYESIHPDIIARNPPALSTLCGLDDAFGKSGYDGADFSRLGYATQAGFGASDPPPALEEVVEASSKGGSRL